MKNHQKTRILLLIIFLLSFVLRWYKLDQYLFFGFEQGRDFFRIQNIANLSDLVLVGPKTDIAGIFHGPWYYYLMTIPFALSKGSPLFGSLFLVLLSSLVPVILFFWARKAFKSEVWALVLALMSVFSFELISYGRWMSNVSLGLVFLVLAWWAFETKNQKEKTKNKVNWKLVLFAGCLGLAAQFQIILTLWLSVFFVLIHVLKINVLPKAKTLFISLAAFAFWYLPLLAFNLKYNFISLKSVKDYLLNSASDSIPLAQVLSTYFDMLWRQWIKGVFNINNYFAFVVLALVIIGVYFAYKQKENQKLIKWSLAWIFMTLPVLLFPHSLGLKQLYIGVCLGFISLTVLALKTWWEKKRLGKLIVGFLIMMFAWGAMNSFESIKSNQDFFFVTIQDDLNLKDQLDVLGYIQNVREEFPNVSYHVKAFTIPYYQEEGWLYLQQYYLGEKLDPGADDIFVVIENKVDPYWQEQWIKDLGETELVEERQFGLLRVQFRARSSKI